MTARLFVAALVVAFQLASATSASADPAIARRLAALQALVGDPRASAPRLPSLGCADDAWWRGSDYARRDRIQTAIRDASLRYAIDAALIRSVIRVESAGNVDAVSHKGAMGLMQLMPATARELGVHCAFDPRQNVLGGARYLRQMRDRLGSWPRALAAYNAGPHRVEARRIPNETRRYVRNVLRGWRPALPAGELQLH